MPKVTYKENFIEDTTFLNDVLSDAQNLKWCLPPAGIPGNNPPRYVSVFGNGATIRDDQTSNLVNKPNFYPKEVAYPMYQCAKSSSCIYNLQPIPKNLSKLILYMRNSVRDIYGSDIIDVDNMFNVGVCSLYTEKIHRISEHRDDERWLYKNELDAHGKPIASIIASLTLYIDSKPDDIRPFDIYDDQTEKWDTIELKHNSVVFFSNHRHRVKPMRKKTKNNTRLNITFRTLAPGLLGLTGYGNFYRYMSLPYKINIVDDNHLKWVHYFTDSVYKNNDDTIHIKIKKVDKIKRNSIKLEIGRFLAINLPRYVKPLCSVENYQNYLKFVLRKKIHENTY